MLCEPMRLSSPPLQTKVTSTAQRKQRREEPDRLCRCCDGMVDSVIAGVAFSANPLNSGRDELAIDSSWGLGDSVVDGSVTSDRHVVDKIQRGRVIEESIGKKGNEKSLGTGEVVEKATGLLNRKHVHNNYGCRMGLCGRWR